MQEMSESDVVVGALVAPLPSSMGEDWVHLRSWPGRITNIGRYATFQLDGNEVYLWSTSGLYVIDESIEENE